MEVEVGMRLVHQLMDPMNSHQYLINIPCNMTFLRESMEPGSRLHSLRSSLSLRHSSNSMTS